MFSRIWLFCGLKFLQLNTVPTNDQKNENDNYLLQKKCISELMCVRVIWKQCRNFLIDNQDSNARTIFEVGLWAFLCGPKIDSIADHFFSSSFSVLELESSFFVKEIFKVKMFINSEGHILTIVSSVTIFTSYQILMHFYKKRVLWSQIDHWCAVE